MKGTALIANNYKISFLTIQAHVWAVYPDPVIQWDTKMVCVKLCDD